MPQDHIVLFNGGGVRQGRVGGGGMGRGVDCGGHLEINKIHNTDFCYVIKCYNCYAW